MSPPKKYARETGYTKLPLGVTESVHSASHSGCILASLQVTGSGSVVTLTRIKRLLGMNEWCNNLQQSVSLLDSLQSRTFKYHVNLYKDAFCKCVLYVN